QCRLAGSGGADDADELSRLDGEVDAAEGGNGRFAGVGACHAGQLDDGGHAAGTTTRWPARRPSPETWTSPPALSNRPSSTVTRWLSPPVSSTSTAYSLPARARRAVTGTVSTSSTVSVVIATSTGAWSRPAAVPGSVRAARTGTVAEP